jgi:hypothetical protein
MYAFAWESGHTVWKECWYTIMSRVSLQANFYMTREDQIFVTNVVVVNPTWEMVASTFISQLVNVATKLNVIAKIYKYKKGFMKGTTLFQWPWRCTTCMCVIWIVLSRNVPIFSTIKDREVIYPCLFAFNFSNNMLVLLFNVF